jgi:hypothetical protein
VLFSCNCGAGRDVPLAGVFSFRVRIKMASVQNCPEKVVFKNLAIELFADTHIDAATLHHLGLT